MIPLLCSEGDLSDQSEGRQDDRTLFQNLMTQHGAFEQAGADRPERTPTPTARRNRTSDRTLVTRLAMMSFLKPRFGEKLIETQILGL